MKNKKISFLIAAHNEEKIIRKTLDNLLHLPYNSYEVILGLDGCTDKTEEIVKEYCRKSKNFRYYNLNLRQGKPAMINKIIKYAKGEIVIINDADWIFRVKNKKSMENFISVFNNPKIGGIAESFPVQYPARKITGLLETGVIMQNLIWINYVKSKGKKIKDSWIVAEKNFSPLLVNIFRRSLYRENQTLGDDFERFYDIINSKSDVLATNDLNLPRMVSIGETYRFRELITIKERTALARNQLKTNKKPVKLFSPKFFFYIIKNMSHMSLKEILGFSLLNLAFIIGAIKGKIKKNISTKDGWKMRLTR